MERVGTLIGPYRLRHRVGSGGMGEVFAAFHERMEQEVALKLLSPDAARDQQLVARFLQEGRALARLQHPGVVQVLNCDQLDDGTVFLAMELLQGLSLREWMRRQPGPVPREVALALGKQVAEVMADIHAKEVVHRDLKPENVFLCPSPSVEPGYRIKLLDFGIAKVPPALSGSNVDTQVQTQAPTFLGTATYMAPEQFRNAATVDGRADVYSLGVMLFELLTGRPPFDSSEQVEVISMHIRAEPPSLQEALPATPGVFSAFVSSMLSKNPQERPGMLRCLEVFSGRWDDRQDECPIPGLLAFTESQAELFFGRQTEIGELLTLLEASHEGLHRWVQLEGPSGVGKSSLVQAGLLPRLKQALPQQSPRWRIASLRPSHSPLRSLAVALLAAYKDTGLDRSPEQLEEALHAGPDALQRLVKAYTPPGSCLLLVIEQMEELLTLGEADRLRMEELVASALSAPDSSLRLLTTLRSDFIYRLEQLPRLSRQLNEAVRYYLRPMEDEALTQAIHGMAQRAGLRLSEGLPERMVRDTTSESSRLPLLSHTLRGLWALRHGTSLTHERYEQLGGVGGALARQAEELLDSLGAEGRERAKWLLLDLVHVSHGVHGAPAIRRSRLRQEVLASAGGDALAEEVLLRLSGMRSETAGKAEQTLRLIDVSGEPEPTQQRVDLIHETLLQKVPSFVGWLEHERTLLERNMELEVAAHAWEQAGCPRGDLPTGTLLQHYRESAGARTAQGHQARRASERATRFLESAMRFDLLRARVKRALIVACLAATVASMATAIQASSERQRAETTLQQAIGLTNDFVSDVDWVLGRRAHTLEARDQLLKRFGELLAKLPEQDRKNLKVLLVSIKTWQRHGDLFFHDGTLSQADHIFDSARHALQQGLMSHPGNPDLMFRLGLDASKRGKIARAREHWEQARVYFLEANSLFARPHPTHRPEDHRRTQATSYSELADLDLASGQTAAARALYDRAIALLEQNSSSYDQSLLAETLGARAKAAWAARDAKAAEHGFTAALTLGRALSQSDPGDTYYRWVLTQILVEFARFRFDSRAFSEAASLYKEAQDHGRVLHEGEKPNKRYALVLAESLLGGEQLAESLADAARTAQLREERCALISDFVRTDPEDARFQRLACP
ncbi:protein kinase domain-containing protein [Hyalangium rubrum]|uniref:non-specific serine/threonine protein kinase n=1 Tax=Hyalangium rubrum TaxID=3103134 RepID=A0ABU5HBP0_9BACT|nr:protein kinase [Hyalangium sp. s54d21]MDY7230248.1 protein kinase [Hyalangium sp. s54d21]